MALNGVNLALAYTGQEYVYRKVRHGHACPLQWQEWVCPFRPAKTSLLPCVVRTGTRSFNLGAQNSNVASLRLCGA
jgi:hypothetical protein